MKTIAICNHKGGVGKTALSMAIAEGLHRKGKRTLLVDLDQGLTFDRCTVHTKTFAAGQLYVGLSRCSNIEGLTIFPKMEKNRLHASREVIDFYARMEKKAASVSSAAGEALPWEREDAPGRDYQSTWNQF